MHASCCPSSMNFGREEQQQGQANRSHKHQHTLQLVVASCVVALLLAPQHCVAARTLFADSEASASLSVASPFAKVQHLALVFPLKPLSHPPTPPPAYEHYPADQWAWVGGVGYFMITKSDFGLLGVLTEAWYLPGQYQPKCSSKTTTYFSAERLWVNMEVSRDIGRKVWGFPKEMAKFEWGPRSIAVTDGAGKKIFSASFSAPLSHPSPAWLTTLANDGLNTIQWPINDENGLGKAVIDIQLTGDRYSNADAFIAAHLLPKPLVTIFSIDAPGTLIPNTQHLGFNGSSPDAVIYAPGYKQLKLVRASKVEFNAEAFTGRVGHEVQLAQGPEVGFIKGTPGSLDSPRQCTN